MARVVIVGAGGVGRVVAHKCAQNSEVFSDIILASKTHGKCKKIQKEIKQKQNKNIKIGRVDANNLKELVKLLKNYKPDIVINVALPYQDLTIMDACLEVGCDYLDTANYEHPDSAKFEYKEQWAKDEDFK